MSTPKQPSGITVTPFGEFKSGLPKDNEKSVPPLLSEKEIQLAHSMKKDFATMIVEKFVHLSNSLHARYGNTFLVHSREHNEKFGRTWFLCLIEPDNWMDDSAPLHIEIIISNRTWATETRPETLAMLYEMDMDNEYMLSFEIYDPVTKFVYEKSATVLRRTEIIRKQHLFQRSWKMTVDKETEVPNAYKGFCQGCFGLQTDIELLACAKCHEVRYCSVDCQTKDWEHHKTCCSILKKLRDQEDVRKAKK